MSADSKPDADASQNPYAILHTAEQRSSPEASYWGEPVALQSVRMQPCWLPASLSEFPQYDHCEIRSQSDDMRMEKGAHLEVSLMLITPDGNKQFLETLLKGQPQVTDLSLASTGEGMNCLTVMLSIGGTQYCLRLNLNTEQKTACDWQMSQQSPHSHRPWVFQRISRLFSS